VAGWEYLDEILFKQISQAEGFRIFVPTTTLRNQIIYTLHDSGLHASARIITPQITSKFYWPKMVRYILNWHKGCVACGMINKRHTKPAGLLHSIKPETGRWTAINVDCVYFDSNFSVLVVVCRQSTRGHFFKITSSNLSQDEFFNVLITRYYPLHGIPLDIYSDMGAAFHKSFITRIWDMLGCTPTFSTTGHASSNVLAEQTNKFALAYFRRIKHRHPSITLSQALPLFEFAYNSMTRPSNRSLHITRFKADLGYQPHGLGIIPDGSEPHLRNASAETLMDALSELDGWTTATLREIQEFYAMRYNAHHRDQYFKVGDLVRISTEFMSNDTAKLDKIAYIGPFKILQILPYDDYLLELTSIHSGKDPRFHISMLEPYIAPLPGQPAITISQDSVSPRTIERITKHQNTRGRPLYWIRWKNHGAHLDSKFTERELLPLVPQMVKDYQLENGIAPASIQETLFSQNMVDSLHSYSPLSDVAFGGMYVH
jgi:hypothetical protein